MTLCPAYFQLVIIIIIKYFRNLVFVPSGRKSQFLNFLRKVQNANHVTMPPHPTTKSWSAWFDCVEYYADRYLLFEKFVKEEISQGRSMASNSLLRLEEMYKDQQFMTKLQDKFAFLKVKAPILMFYLNFFQQQVPHATEAHGQLQNLLQYLDENSRLIEKDLTFYFDGLKLTKSEKSELASLFQSAFVKAHDKLSQYIVDGGQPASEFLEQIRVLNPKNLVGLDFNFDSIDSIPGFKAVSRSEWEMYTMSLGPNAVTGSSEGQFNLKLFWKSKAAELPELFKLASCYCTVTVSLYDVKRSFSSYQMTY